MAIAVRINNQNQQKVRTMSPISPTSLEGLSDVSISAAAKLANNNGVLSSM